MTGRARIWTHSPQLKATVGCSGCLDMSVTIRKWSFSRFFRLNWTLWGVYSIFRPISPLLDVLEESTSHLGHFAWPFDSPCSSSGAADALQYLKAGTSLGGYEDSINSEGPTRWVCWLNTKIWQVIGWLAARSNRCRMCVCVCVSEKGHTTTLWPLDLGECDEMWWVNLISQWIWGPFFHKANCTGQHEWRHHSKWQGNRPSAGCFCQEMSMALHVSIWDGVVSKRDTTKKRNPCNYL